MLLYIQYNKCIFFCHGVYHFIAKRKESRLTVGRLWFRGKASVLLLEGRWLDSPVLHVELSLGKILNPKLLLMCWLAATTICVWMYIWITVGHFGEKASAKIPAWKTSIDQHMLCFAAGLRWQGCPRCKCYCSLFLSQRFSLLVLKLI